MPTYEFEIQGYMRIKVDADDKQDARMKLVDRQVHFDLMDTDYYISDGELVE